jgi:hypothetical protein
MEFVVVAGIRAEILTGNLPNVTWECYQPSHGIRYIDVSGKIILRVINLEATNCIELPWNMVLCEAHMHGRMSY